MLAGRVGDLLARAAERYVPTTFVRLNGILLSRRTVAILRKYHSSQRRLFRNIRGGIHLPIVNAIRVEVGLLRQMMIRSVGSDLSSHYRSTMADTISTRHAHRTVTTHTSYRKRGRCPNLIYADEAKTTVVTGASEIADSFQR